VISPTTRPRSKLHNNFVGDPVGSRLVFSIALGGLVLLVTASGCAPMVPPDALALAPDSLRLRQLQTRRFETKDEMALLQASLGVLQDLGFEVDESESRLGVIVASKMRDATDAAQVVGSIIIGALSESRVPYDVEQKIRASVVTRAISPRETSVRVTFQRMVWDDMGQVSRAESLDDPELYREFFYKLSKSVFLEAHGI
jgi:hypothetical protein